MIQIFLKEFIFDNINYRRHVWNDFVEESKKYDSLLDFKPLKFHTAYTTEVDRRSYKYYCEGVSKGVSRQIVDAKEKCLSRSKKEHRCFELQFKSFDRFRGSFTVDARPTKLTLSDTSERWNTKVNFVSPTEIYFRANRNLYIPLTTKEPFFYDIDDNGYFILDRNDFRDGWNTCRMKKRCRYRVQDVRQVVFIHEIGHFYIQLSINMTFINKTKEIQKRKDVAGIDLGIHNPIMITDSNGSYSLKMSDKELNRIYYLQRRARRLQGIMDKKIYINKKRGINPHSKNFERVRKKFRKTWRRIFMIRDNWKKKTCKMIAERYQLIVVDLCKTPTPDVQDTHLPKSVIRKLNSKSRLYAMSYINEYLPYACMKYGTKIHISEQHTTRTCSRCSHKNPHLPLSQRYFICEKCGYGIDRDQNASQNCYNHGLDLYYEMC